MRNKLHNDELEDYLQDQVKNHRMYAADNVWRNIQNTLHVERSWHALTFTSIFIIAALTAGTLFTKPNTHLARSQYHPATTSTITVTEKENKTSTEILRQHLSAENITTQTIQQAVQDIALKQAIDPAMQSQNGLAADNVDASAAMMKVNEPEKYSHESVIDYAGKNSSLMNANLNAAQQDEDKQQIEMPFSTNPFGAYSSFSFMKPLVPQKKGFMFMNSFSSRSDLFLHQNQKFAAYWLSLPAYYNFTPHGKTSRWSYDIYATPSVSYRRLYDITTKHSPQTFITALPLNQSGYTIDVNKSVKHKPGVGLEAGFAFGYKLTPQLTVKGGLQFNMRQYYIEAGNLTSPNADLSNIISIDSVNSNFTNRTVSNNNSSITLTDRYYEISMPLGLDWKAVSLKKISIGIAGSIQPTYTFAKQPFVVTSDFKSYADGSSIMRNWNINTTFETYFAYKVGAYTWQIGPQFRYQQLPTFNSQYPIREHLLDYGLKVGISKSIK